MDLKTIGCYSPLRIIDIREIDYFKENQGQVEQIVFPLENQWCFNLETGEKLVSGVCFNRLPEDLKKCCILRNIAITRGGKEYDLEKLIEQYGLCFTYMNLQLYQIEPIKMYVTEGENETSPYCTTTAIDSEGDFYFISWEVMDVESANVNDLCEWNNYEIEYLRI